MQPSKTYYPEALTIAILAALLLIGSCQYLRAQLTVEGPVAADVQSLYLIDADGTPRPVTIKHQGTKRARYSITIEARNTTMALRAQIADVAYTLHIFTHQPDDRIVRWYEPHPINSTNPHELLLYWSPSQRNYIRARDITTEDANRLAEMKLWPNRIHPSIIRWE